MYQQRQGIIALSVSPLVLKSAAGWTVPITFFPSLIEGKMLLRQVKMPCFPVSVLRARSPTASQQLIDERRTSSQSCGSPSCNVCPVLILRISSLSNRDDPGKYLKTFVL